MVGPTCLGVMVRVGVAADVCSIGVLDLLAEEAPEIRPRSASAMLSLAVCLRPSPLALLALDIGIIIPYINHLRSAFRAYCSTGCIRAFEPSTGVTSPAGQVINVELFVNSVAPLVAEYYRKFCHPFPHIGHPVCLLAGLWPILSGWPWTQTAGFVFGHPQL